MKEDGGGREPYTSHSFLAPAYVISMWGRRPARGEAPRRFLLLRLFLRGYDSRLVSSAAAAAL